MKCSNNPEPIEKKRSKKRRSTRRYPLPAPRTWSEHLYVEVDRCDIALFKFILESYDNLAYLSVLDKYRALVRLTFSPDARKTIQALLGTLGHDITIRAVVQQGTSPAPIRVAP